MTFLCFVCDYIFFKGYVFMINLGINVILFVFLFVTACSTTDSFKERRYGEASLTALGFVISFVYLIAINQ